MDIEINRDIENLLVGRREVECIFRDSYGSFSRNDAIQALSKKIKTTDEKVFVVSIDGESGSRDAKGLFYIYDTDNSAKKDISDYILTRNKPVTPKSEKSKTPSKNTGEEKAEPIQEVDKTSSTEDTKDELVKPEEKPEAPSEATEEQKQE
jgi:ribosomal protein S24E|tara:strand:- start:655 stop:1107 length:453 start_codon:yes stop_codon:yes gene_type:complete